MSSRQDGKALLFDMDGVLVDTEAISLWAVEQALAAAGIGADDDDRAVVLGRPWQAILSHLTGRYPEAGPAERLKREIIAIKWRRIEAEGGLRVLPGARGMLERVGEKWRIGVVSGSFREEVERTLALLGWSERVATLLGDEDCAPGKPDPTCYLQAARRLGVDPAGCIVFEDSTAGIAAARAAGMYCVALSVANHWGFSQAGADRRIVSLADVDTEFLEGCRWN